MVGPGRIRRSGGFGMLGDLSGEALARGNGSGRTAFAAAATRPLSKNGGRRPARPERVRPDQGADGGVCCAAPEQSTATRKSTTGYLVPREVLRCSDSPP